MKRNGNYSVKLKTIVEAHDLHPLHLSKDYESALLTTADINRPAMQLTGFYNYFDPKRLQIMGRVESTYLDTLSSEERRAAFERFMQYDIAGLVICHSVPAFPECIEMAEKYDRNVFITHEDTSEFQADVHPVVNHLIVGLGEGVCVGINDLDGLDGVPSGGGVFRGCRCCGGRCGSAGAAAGIAACAEGKYHDKSKKQSCKLFHSSFLQSQFYFFKRDVPA